jgi:large subunit ribosomal protein L21e
MAMKKGFKNKTRHKLRKNIKEKGKISITRYMNEFKKGDKVSIKIDSSVNKGMPHPNYHGKTGVVVEKAGECYKTKIRDKHKEKILIVHPIHLNRL